MSIYTTFARKCIKTFEKMDVLLYYGICLLFLKELKSLEDWVEK